MKPILLGKGVLGDGLAGPRYRWYAPAWAVDGSGYAYANPTLGPELFANGAFAADANWTKGTGWSIAGGVAVGTAVGASGLLTQSVLGADLTPYVLSFDIITQTSGVITGRDSAAFGSGFSTVGSCVATRYPSQSGVSGVAGSASAWTGAVDNLSAKIITQVSHAGVRARNVRQVGIRIHTMSGNHQFQLYGWSSEFPLVEAANCIRITQAGSAVTGPFRPRLAKQVNTAFTALVTNTPTTFVQDALLEIRRPNGNTFQMWYNGVQIGADQTVNDASVINNDIFSFSSLHPTTLISEFQINGAKVPFRF